MAKSMLFKTIMPQIRVMSHLGNELIEKKCAGALQRVPGAAGLVYETPTDSHDLGFAIMRFAIENQ